MSTAPVRRNGADEGSQRHRGISGRELDRRVVLRAAAGVAAIAAAGGIGSAAPIATAQDERERVTRAGEWEPPAARMRATAVGSSSDWQGFETDFPFYAIGASWPVDVGLWPVVEVQLSADGNIWSEIFRLAADNDGGGGTDANAERYFTPLIHTKASNFVQFRTVDAEGNPSPVTGLRFTYIDATDGPWEKDIGGESAAEQLDVQAEEVDTTTPPPIVTRADWGANESYRFASYGEVWPPEYATVEHVIIHHTDTPNTQDIPTAVRSIYYYHAITQGWGDIGYNYLVGRDGRIYQGRYGGQNVIGGHSYQYAIGSSGISIIGDFQSTPVPRDALAGLVSIVAWVGRDLDPYGEADFHETLDLPTICSHRDVNATTCPGDYLYNELPQIRDMVAATLDAGDLETPFPGGIVVGDRVMVNTANDDSLNLRSGAGTSTDVVGSLPHGAFATVVDGPAETDEGNWYMLDAEDSDLAGWAVADYLLVTPFLIDTSGIAYGTNIAARSTTNIRTSPTTSAGVGGTAAGGDLGFIMAGPQTADGYDWYQVHWQNGTEGWTAEEFLAIVPVDENPTATFAVGDYAIATQYIDVYVRPGLAQSIISSLPTGGRLQITKEPIGVNGYVWYGAYTENDDGGWVVESSLRASGDPPEGKFDIGDRVRVTESLRLRTSASTSAGTIAVMPAGTTGDVVGGPERASGYTWWQIQTADYGTGWAVQDWMVETDGGTTPPPTGKFQEGDTVRVTENMNMRSGPSTGYGVVTVLPAGTTGTVVSGPRTGSGYTWWQIQTSRGTGWVVENWMVEDDGGTTPPPTGRFEAGDTVRVTENMNMRSGPSTSNGVIAVLPAGTTGTVLDGPRSGSGYTWWQIETSRGTGWVVEDWMVEDDGGSTPPPPTGRFQNGDVVRVTENLNMRSGASTGNGVIAVLPSGTRGTVVGGPQTGSGYTWWRIETSYGTGWVVDDWLVADGGTPPPAGKFQNGDQVRATENLNMRTGPSTGSSVVRLLPAGTTGTVVDGPQTGSGYTWWRLETSYGTGWVAEDWLVRA